MRLCLQLLIISVVFVFVQSFTECENKYLGWSRLNGTFSDKQLITICDKRFRGGSIYKKVKKKYSQIDCYIDDKTKQLYSCRFHNVYGTFIEYTKIFRFAAYCVIVKENKKYLESEIKIDDENIKTLKELFKLLMIEIDTINPPPIYSKSYINIINQNIWNYDNINAISRCMSYIPKMNEYIPNPLYCLSALSLLFEYQYLLNETRQQSSYIAVRYKKDMFNDKHLLTQIIKTYFNDIITIQDVIKYSDGEEIYIKELRFNAKNWIKHSLFINNLLYKKCKHDLNKQRSPILMNMANVAVNYWNNNKIINDIKNNWLYLIDKENKMNQFQIYTKYGCNHYNHYFNALDERRNIIFVLNKYINNTMDIFVDELVMALLFDHDNDLLIDIVIVGNPDLLSFKMQYLLFRNTNILIGAYDPILSVAMLFMKQQSIIFEIVTKEGINMEHLAKMTNMRYYKMNNIDIHGFVNKLK